LEKMTTGTLAFEESLLRLGREAVLQPAALCIAGVDILAKDSDKFRAQLDALFHTLTLFSRLTFLLGRERLTPTGSVDGPGFVAVDVPLPNAQRSAQLWETYLARDAMVAPQPSAASAADLASRFRLGPGTMHQAVIAARDIARWRAPRQPRMTT